MTQSNFIPDSHDMFIVFKIHSSLLHLPASGTAGKFIIHTKLSLVIHPALLHTAKVFIDDRLEKHPLSEHKTSAISSKSLTSCQVGPIASGQLADKIMAVPFPHNSFLPFTEIPLLNFFFVLNILFL